MINTVSVSCKWREAKILTDYDTNPIEVKMDKADIKYHFFFILKWCSIIKYSGKITSKCKIFISIVNMLGYQYVL